MMKSISCLLAVVVCISFCFGSLSDADEAADGYLTVGEYDGSDFEMEESEVLLS